MGNVGGMITLSEFQFAQNEDTRNFSCRVEHSKFPNKLFFSAKGEKILECKSPKANWAAVSLLYPAMALGEDLKIEGNLSPKLLYALRNDVQALLKSYKPSLKRIKIYAFENNSEYVVGSGRAATGFSAGVDSFTTLKLYSNPAVPDKLSITDLTIFDVGAMGPYGSTGRIFEYYTSRLKNFAKLYGVNWFAVSSNLGLFYELNGHGFQKTHTLRNISAALIFEDIYDYYYYSATYSYRDINSSTNCMAYIDLILLPLLATEKLQFVSAGAGYSRVEKTKIISEIDFAKSLLDVCIADPNKRLDGKYINCSKCWKCCRTMVTLEVLGRLEEFSNVFDIEYYKNNKAIALKTIAMTWFIEGRPAERELLQLLKREGVHVTYPVYEIGVAKIRSKLRTIKLLRKIYRMVKK